MWTETTRPKYERAGLRYSSDLTAEEWAVLEPLLPAAKPIGRPRTTDLREVVNDGVRHALLHYWPGRPRKPSSALTAAMRCWKVRAIETMQ